MPSVEGDVVWHRGQTLAAGQVVEFKVWAELIRQSTGGLHVFLPLRDLGIDGVLHRLSDGSYVPVQVKGRMELTPAGQVHITVTASSLVDDDAFMIATLVDGDRLGSMVLVVDEATFRSLSASDVVEGREYLTAAFELHAGGTSRWTAYLVPREKLAERFGTLRLGAHGEALEVGTRVDRGREGFLGEAEVIRRLAEGDSLNLFRPFPDLETVEVLVRHIVSRRFLGLQVKTAGWDTTHAENRIYVRRSSFRPAPSTFVCVLGLERKTSSFAGDCLLIPSSEIASLARIEGEWMVLELEPQSVRHRRLDSYRTPLASLASTVDAMLV